MEGARCLAAPDGYWAPGRIHRVNEDGTYTIEFDEKQMVIMPYWFGVTHDQVSINDESHWSGIYARLTGDSSAMARVVFAKTLADAGYRFNELVDACRLAEIRREWLRAGGSRRVQLVAEPAGFVGGGPVVNRHVHSLPVQAPGDLGADAPRAPRDQRDSRRLSLVFHQSARRPPVMRRRL